MAVPNPERSQAELVAPFDIPGITKLDGSVSMRTKQLRYAVSGDRQRFIVNQTVGALEPIPITVNTTFGKYTYAVQANIYAGMRKDTRSIERAYVDLSHAPPGLEIDAPQGNTQRIHCRIVLKNHGRASADILVVLLRLFAHTALPAQPPYASNTPMRCTVMPGETVNWTNPFTVPAAEVQQVQANAKTLWIIGYVDYRDRRTQAEAGRALASLCNVK